MDNKKNYSAQIVAILFVMFLALTYFIYYRSRMNDAFEIKRSLPVTQLDYSDGDLVLLDMENLPENITVDQSLLLVNSDHPLPDDFEADVVFYHDTDVLMNRPVVDAYAALSAEIRSRYDDKLYIESSYRSREHQQEIYDESGPEIAALPGTSEHETGLALDVYVMYYAGAGFINCAQGKYVNNNCEDYGFIIRYPRGEEKITGFEYEPWHIRYVGQPHAELIASCHLTFEEYIDSFEPGHYYSYSAGDDSDWILARLPEGELRIPAEYIDCPIRISPDNCGCLFVTIEL